MPESFSWLRSMTRAAVILALFTLFGGQLGAYWAGLVAGTLALLGFHYWHLREFGRWLEDKRLSPPQGYGEWEPIFEGVHRVIRYQRRKRQQLGKLVRRYKKGAEALSDAAVLLDQQGTILWFNRLARFELGLQWPDDVGRRIDTLIRQPDFIVFFRRGESSEPLEQVSPHNPDKLLEYRLMPYGEDELLMIARDFTQVARAETMRRDFVANISHELRTPLTVFSGYLELLQQDSGLTGELREQALGSMQNQATRMQQLVDDLLTLSRIEAGQHSIGDTAVDMPSMLAEIEAEVAALNADYGHDIRFEVDPRLCAYGIAKELRSACLNLIVNALRYTPKGGTIRVYWQTIQGRGRFSVRDNGEGIAPAHIGRLTERFYRVDKARSSATGGTGLGLAIVKHVLAHHNTRLEINSTLGKGSEFAFTLAENFTLLVDTPQEYAPRRRQ